MMKSKAKLRAMNIPRRAFLLLAGGAFLRGDDRPKADMLVRSVRPEDLEMPLSGFSDYITPIEHFFVRTHVYAPKVELDSWRLRVDGEVAPPGPPTREGPKEAAGGETR